MNIEMASRICSKCCTERICSCLLGPRTRVSQGFILRCEISVPQGRHTIFACNSDGCTSLYSLHVRGEGRLSRARMWIWLVRLHACCGTVGPRCHRAFHHPPLFCLRTDTSVGPLLSLSLCKSIYWLFIRCLFFLSMVIFFLSYNTTGPEKYLKSAKSRLPFLTRSV